MKRVRVWSIFLLILSGVSIFVPLSSMRAQSVISGEITVTVTDPTGAVVPSATLSLMNTETGFNATGTTNASGTFRFPLLRPGIYSLTATAKGFKVSKSSATAAVGQVVDVPVQLEIGATTETVEV